MTSKESDKASDKVRVAFSLNSKSQKKRKRPNPSTQFRDDNDNHSHNYGHDHNNDGQDRTSETHTLQHTSNQPLIIPLRDTQKGSLLQRRMKEIKKENKGVVLETTRPKEGPETQNELAAAALQKSATQYLTNKRSNQQTGTNFSPRGELVISAAADANLTSTLPPQKGRDKDQDKLNFAEDMARLPDSIGVDSESYNRVPISEFGAALLRGMGWTGEESSNAPAAVQMRPHRLGLGATPKISTKPRASNKIRTQDQVRRDERVAKQQLDFEAQRQKRLQQDKQVTLQVGSIVWYGDQRAKLLQLTGVPGLNQVRIQVEGSNVSKSVKRGTISMASRSDLEHRPYRDIGFPNTGDNINANARSGYYREGEVGDRTERPRREKARERSSERDQFSDRIRSETRRTHRTDDRGKRECERNNREGGERRQFDRRGKKQERREERKKGMIKAKTAHQSSHWIISSIRVRVVTKKLGSRYFKEKAIVIDVTQRGKATLQMPDGQVVESVPERYLETALPKVGGSAIILSGNSKYAKGKLLERNSELGKGVVQIYEDMSVVTLSLDDIAEWCGGLDEAMSY